MSNLFHILQQGENENVEFKTDNYRASTRNKLLAEALYLTHDIKKYGSGFIRIKKAIADYPTMKFNYKNANYGFFSEFSYKKQKVSVNDTLSDTLSNTLNQYQKKDLLYIKKNPGCQRNQINENLDIPYGSIIRHINFLQKHNLIERRGSKKTGGYWQII